MMSTDDEYDDEEPLSLGSEALQALQSVLRVGLDQMSLHSLIESRRCEDEEDCEVEDDNKDDMVQSGESHAEYYKRLFPERYLNPSGQQATTMDTITHPVSLAHLHLRRFFRHIPMHLYKVQKAHFGVILCLLLYRWRLLQ
jgi:hypothetical protein